jgi:hypothetical protein
MSNIVTSERKLAILSDVREYELSNLTMHLFNIRSSNIWNKSKSIQQEQNKFIDVEDSRKQVHYTIKNLQTIRLEIIELEISLL